MGGEAVLVDVRAGLYFGLDPVGTRIWELLAEPRTFDGLLEALRLEYDVGEAQLRTDVERLLGELVTAGLAQVGDGSP